MAQSEATKKQAAKSRAKQQERNAGNPVRRKAVDALRDQNAGLQASLMNLRQMYDQKVVSLQLLEQQLNSRTALLVALVSESGGTVSISKEVVDSVTSRFEGLNVHDGGADIVIELVEVEDDDAE